MQVMIDFADGRKLDVSDRQLFINATMLPGASSDLQSTKMMFSAMIHIIISGNQVERQWSVCNRHCMLIELITDLEVRHGFLQSADVHDMDIINIMINYMDILRCA